VELGKLALYQLSYVRVLIFPIPKPFRRLVEKEPALKRRCSPGPLPSSARFALIVSVSVWPSRRPRQGDRGRADGATRAAAQSHLDSHPLAQLDDPVPASGGPPPRSSLPGSSRPAAISHRVPPRLRRRRLPLTLPRLAGPVAQVAQRSQRPRIVTSCSAASKLIRPLTLSIARSSEASSNGIIRPQSRQIAWWWCSPSGSIRS